MIDIFGLPSIQVRRPVLIEADEDEVFANRFNIPLHECTVCGFEGRWSKDWNWYASIAECDAGEPIVKLCSNQCRAQVDDPEKLLRQIRLAAGYPAEFKMKKGRREQ